MTLSSGRGTSTGQGEKIECLHCHKYHYSTCRRITRGCFRCGSTDHLIVNCPQGLGFLEILKEVAEEDRIYLHRLIIGVEGEVV